MRGFYWYPAFDAQQSVAGDIHFDRLELVDRSLRDGHPLVPVEEMTDYRHGLDGLSENDVPRSCY